MPRSHRCLWPEVVSWENLVPAYQRCRRRKRYKPDAVRFHHRWEEHLLELQAELSSGNYHPGLYRHFWVTQPKRRLISAAPFRDRVVHHAVVAVLEPRYEPAFIYDSYACRRGKGTHRAVRRAQSFLRRSRYYLKTDVVKFFPNVDHGALMDRLTRRIRDDRLLELIGRILASGEGVLRDEATATYFPGDDLWAVTRPKGLPIGNLTSQFFANVLLDTVDHFVKEDLRIRGYVRYADDLVLFADSKDELRTAERSLRDKFAELRLRMHRDKTVIAPTRCGLNFLGFRVHPESIRLSREAIERFNRRLRRQKWLYAQGRITPEELRRSLAAWRAHAEHANTFAIRGVLMRKARFRRDSNR